MLAQAFVMSSVEKRKFKLKGQISYNFSIDFFKNFFNFPSKYLIFLFH